MRLVRLAATMTAFVMLSMATATMSVAQTENDKKAAAGKLCVAGFDKCYATLLSRGESASRASAICQRNCAGRKK